LKVIIEQISENEEEQVVIRCKQMRPNLLQHVADSLVNSDGKDLIADKKKVQFLATCEKEIYFLCPSDILYIESVDGISFMYDKKRVYESAQKLKEFEVLLRSDNFIRASRTMIVNLEKVRSFFPVLGGQLGITMINGEKLIITRRYAKDVRAVLGIWNKEDGLT